jgi:hypothetical protein
MAKPNLALIPAAQGSKLFSVLPSSGVGDFDFSRSGKATRINSQGLIEEVANGQSRLNYPMIDGKVVGCPHHILEPARTNLIINSQKISLTPTKAGTYTDNFAISPDGTLNATKLTATSTDPYFYQNISYSAASYTASIYIKGIGNSVGKDFQIRLASNIYTDVIPSEWTRFEYTVTMPSGASNIGVEIPNPAVIGDEVLVWGWQLEEGSFATSYIPTNGEANGVTRAAETANGSGDASTFNDSEGVLMVEGSFLSATSSPNRRIAISDGTTSNRILIQNVGSSANRLQFYTIVNNATSTDFYTDLSDITLFNKIVFKYKINNFSVWINGFEVLTDTSGITFPNGTLTEIAFDGGDGGNDFYGKTKQIQYYNSALTDSELEKLTSWVSFQDMAEGQLYTIE